MQNKKLLGTILPCSNFLNLHSDILEQNDHSPCTEKKRVYVKKCLVKNVTDFVIIETILRTTIIFTLKQVLGELPSLELLAWVGSLAPSSQPQAPSFRLFVPSCHHSPWLALQYKHLNNHKNCPITPLYIASPLGIIPYLIYCGFSYSSLGTSPLF